MTNTGLGQISIVAAVSPSLLTLHPASVRAACRSHLLEPRAMGRGAARSVQRPPGRLEVTASVQLVGLEVAALAPFVPCVEEDQPVVLWLGRAPADHLGEPLAIPLGRRSVQHDA